jgi:hypothetical protein
MPMTSDTCHVINHMTCTSSHGTLVGLQPLYHDHPLDSPASECSCSPVWQGQIAYHHLQHPSCGVCHVTLCGWSVLSLSALVQWPCFYLIFSIMMCVLIVTPQQYHDTNDGGNHEEDNRIPESQHCLELLIFTNNKLEQYAIQY